MKFTKEQINKIIDLTGNDGKQIDIFKLYGILYIGNTENGKWDLNKTFVLLSSHTLPIEIEDFKDCETEECIIDQFSELFKNVINEKLI